MGPSSFPPADDGGPSDDSLMAAIGSGDQAAFRMLARRHLPRVVRMAQRMLANPTDAEEVGQEAMVRAWQVAGRWQAGGARFTTWLYRITLNLCIDRIRRPTFAALDQVEEPPDPAPGADAMVEAAQRRAKVADALRRLPPRQRAALTLCYYEGLSCAEAAQVLALRVSAVESLLVRGRRRLRIALDALRPDRDGDTP